MPGPLGAVAGAKTLHGRRSTPNFTFGLFYTRVSKIGCGCWCVYICIHTPLIIPVSWSPFHVHVYMFAMIFIYANSVHISILVKGQYFCPKRDPYDTEWSAFGSNRVVPLSLEGAFFLPWGLCPGVRPPLEVTARDCPTGGGCSAPFRKDCVRDVRPLRR